MKFNGWLMAFLLIPTVAFAADKTPIRIGVQVTGTVAWEMAILQKLETDFNVMVQETANPEAGKVALQSGAVDVIVSDWLWVSRLRGTGSDVTFYPYSSTSGALVVPKDSPIKSVKDLPGKRLGIAGGELDKNWLLLQALGKQEGLDLRTAVEKTFGAPPLLNEQLQQNRIDALLTYWHFAARLEAKGYRQIIDGKQILQGLGINENVPALGFVFKESWAQAHKEALAHFLAASLEAKKQLCTSDQAWHDVLPLTKAEDEATQTVLRQHYCEGNVSALDSKQQHAAEKIYSILHKISDGQLTGSGASLHPGTFWVQ